MPAKSMSPPSERFFVTRIKPFRASNGKLLLDPCEHYATVEEPVLLIAKDLYRQALLRTGSRSILPVMESVYLNLRAHPAINGASYLEGYLRAIIELAQFLVDGEDGRTQKLVDPEELPSRIGHIRAPQFERDQVKCLENRVRSLEKWIDQRNETITTLRKELRRMCVEVEAKKTTPSFVEYPPHVDSSCGCFHCANFKMRGR